jgi:hypothetical protein
LIHKGTREDTRFNWGSTRFRTSQISPNNAGSRHCGPGRPSGRSEIVSTSSAGVLRFYFFHRK